jgi:hypothetical protein
LLLVLSVLAPLLAMPRSASADRVDESIHKLRRARGYKVRVSAALYLARQRESRAILALVRAVEQDRDAMVRRVAALSLGRAVDEYTADTARRTAIEALERAARRDRDRQVRRGAARGLQRIRGSIAARLVALDDDEMDLLAADSSSSAGRIFVHVGTPADMSRTLPTGGRETLLAAVRGSLRMHAPDYQMASGSQPTRAELASRGLRGFTVNALVASVAVEPKGEFASVKCTVSVRVSPWSGSDGNESLSAHVSASATGNGAVVASRTGTRRAAVDCAVAVAEELAARQVVPFLRRLAAAPR